MPSTPFPSPHTSEQWLQAARSMLAEAEHTVKDRDQRSLLARLKAAVGFALEAWLQTSPRPWGASPVARLAGFSQCKDVPEGVRAAATLLVRARTTDPQLVQIGRPTTGPQAWTRAAREVVDYCAVPPTSGEKAEAPGAAQVSSQPSS